MSENLQDEYKTELRIRKMLVQNKNFSRHESIELLKDVKDLEHYFSDFIDWFTVVGRIRYYTDPAPKAGLKYINHLFAKKGETKVLFTDPDDYDISVEDFHYYCDLKTAYRFKLESDAREEVLLKRANQRRKTDYLLKGLPQESVRQIMDAMYDANPGVALLLSEKDAGFPSLVRIPDFLKSIKTFEESLKAGCKKANELVAACGRPPFFSDLQDPYRLSAEYLDLMQKTDKSVLEEFFGSTLEAYQPVET